MMTNGLCGCTGPLWDSVTLRSTAAVVAGWIAAPPSEEAGRGMRGAKWIPPEAPALPATATVGRVEMYWIELMVGQLSAEREVVTIGVSAPSVMLSADS